MTDRHTSDSVFNWLVFYLSFFTFLLIISYLFLLWVVWLVCRTIDHNTYCTKWYRFWYYSIMHTRARSRQHPVQNKSWKKASRNLVKNNFSCCTVSCFRAICEPEHHSPLYPGISELIGVFNTSGLYTLFRIVLWSSINIHLSSIWNINSKLIDELLMKITSSLMIIKNG